ncbi:MAG TPA: bifunctional DNA-binding transcriptional regulator/O6-methylguanine-DNA methyltransferase Ada [Gammaproteobacteria bacterium]|nr:bifunctional DNA-binding transcriptional regulator/O6-methylguanine-DNA methyltransferase Ada [Gammaproteobacteria bacterium]
MIAEAEMWEMVLRRDPHADGMFVYGVRTTGIFCRPTCPSRRPARGNVRFFATPAAACQAGFRACLRCRPAAASPATGQLALVRAACQRLRSGGPEPSLAELAGQANMSPGHFQRVFRRFVGVSPKQYAIACREARFGDVLRTEARVTDAVYAAGYNSPGVAYAAFGPGMPPSAQRDGAPGRDVRYALASTDLGWIAVAATAKGVCAIDLGDSADALRAGLRRRFRNARLSEDSDGLGALVKAVAGFVERPAAGLELPLDIQGTAFQRRVWQALRSIPVGGTRSYGEIAKEIGAPRAARAVASACAHNPIALAVPCHRVVRADGETGGYRWGGERKRRLLRREKG